MPYQNEIIFFAGYGVICVLVLAIYVVIMFLVALAAHQSNQVILAGGNIAKNEHALKVLSRINRRNRYLKLNR